MHQSEARPAVCEVEIAPGQICSLIAEGRCVFCGHAFCKTHQARNPLTRSGYTNACIDCYLKTPAGKADQAEQERGEAERYFTSGAAREALLTSGVPPVDIYVRDDEWKTQFFGLRHHLVPVWTLMGRGWILGTFKWSYSEWDGTPRDGDFLAALLDMPGEEEWKYITVKYQGLVRVAPCAGGYEWFNKRGGRFLSYNWVGAAQAVRKLTGLPS
jgi:hypothetical protein